MRNPLVSLVALLAFAIPSVALAGAVTLKNKDAKETEILVKRSNSTTTTSVAGRASMELMGAPLTITVKKTGSKVEAIDGETVVLQKGKLTKLVPEGEAVDPGVVPTPLPGTESSDAALPTTGTPAAEPTAQPTP